jgi:hypothetical protein
MRLVSHFDFPAPAHRVAELLGDEDVIKAAATSLDSTDARVTVSGSPQDRFTVAVRRSLPVVVLPDALKPLMPRGMEIRQAAVWEPPTADGGRDGTVAAEVAGAPVEVTGAFRLVNTPTGSTMTCSAEIRASVPLFGRKIEQAALPVVREALEAEHREVTSRLLANSTTES